MSNLRVERREWPDREEATMLDTQSGYCDLDVRVNGISRTTLTVPYPPNKDDVTQAVHDWYKGKASNIFRVLISRENKRVEVTIHGEPGKNLLSEIK